MQRPAEVRPLGGWLRLVAQLLGGGLFIETANDIIPYPEGAPARIM
jgi:hypothetical protein